MSRELTNPVSRLVTPDRVAALARESEESAAVRREGVEERHPVRVERAAEPEVVLAHVAANASLRLVHADVQHVFAVPSALCGELRAERRLPAPRRTADHVQPVLGKPAVDEGVEPGNTA